jgi:hypothetical protein
MLHLVGHTIAFSPVRRRANSRQTLPAARSQLKYDGFSEAASLLEKEALPKHQTGPSTKLSILVEDALAKAAADTADRGARGLPWVNHWADVFGLCTCPGFECP